MNTSKTILFFGTDDFSAAALNALIAANYTIGAVITKPDTPSGRGQKITPPAVKVIAEQHGIAVWQPERLADIIDDIKAFQAPVGVLSSFGRIVPQAILDLFEPGIINVHPSLLPQYRGATPIETAIFNGDATTGVSIMKLVKAMDAGPVYAQQSYTLTGTETQRSLYETLGALGAALLTTHLPAIIDGSLLPTEQTDDATFTTMLKKSDSLIDTSTKHADEIERHVRAYNVFPKTKLPLLGQIVTVTAAHVSATKESEADIATADGSFLAIDELIAPSGRRMSGKAFLNGYKQS